MDSQQEAAGFSSSAGLSAWGLHALAVPGRVLSGTPTSSHNLGGKSGQLAALGSSVGVSASSSGLDVPPPVTE